MKNLNFLKLFLATIFVTTTALFTGCVDDNDDTEAPRLEISPKTLVFNDEGFPVDGSQDYFEISANRKWTATVVDDKTWVTLSKMEGNGSDKVQVSIPEGITDEATVMIQISNQVGVLLTEKVTIRSGNVVPKVVIYNETFGTMDASSNPAVTNYVGWDTTGEGATNVTYTGEGTTIRNTGKSSAEASYEGSGPNVVFFSQTGVFQINKIALNAEQTTLKLTFGGNYSYKPEGATEWDNTFNTNQFNVALSSNGTEWVPISYTKNDGDSKEPYWIFATADFTLKHGINNIYIRFTASSVGNAFRLDDVTLSTGNGGQEIDLGTTDPTVSTTEASQINGTSATLGGSLVNMDIASTTEVGVEYIEYTGEVASINWDNATKAAAIEKATPWKVMITGLTADKQYAVRAYATTATGKIYGSIITFIATAPEPISIADLVTKIKATTTETPIDKDYVIQGIICGDPQSKNCSFGTLYLMTKGATTAGNAVTVYNTDIASETYSLGDEIKVILRKENTKMQVYNSSPQVSGFDPAEIEKISSDNEVIPVETTVDQLLDFVCMPVTIKNVTIEQAGTWKQEENKSVTHKFKVNGADLTVYINKGAEIFKDKPFAAKTGSITGIAAAYKTDAQILPRNLDDVKDFEITGPTIISVTPTQVNFPATGGEETITVEISNQGSSTLQIAPLNGILSAEIGTGNTVKVKAEANTGSEVKQDLVISLSTGGSITVPIKVAGAGENGYELIETIEALSAGKYLMAGYAETSNNGTVLNPYVYQIWQGTLSSSDLVTAAYQYKDNELIAKDTEQTGVEMELVEIAGKPNTYYIKIGDQYLYNPTTATNRKLKLQNTADESVEWKFENKNNGGITASNNEVYLVTANADSRFIRSYKLSSISSYKGIYFFKKK